MKSRVYILINIYKSFTIPFKSIHFLNVDKINYHIPVQLKGTKSRTVFFLTTKRPLGIRGFRTKKNAPYYFQNHSLYNSLMDKSVTNQSSNQFKITTNDFDITHFIFF